MSNVETRSKAVSALLDAVEAGRPLVYVQTPEEDRISLLLERVAAQGADGKADLYTWSITEGLSSGGKPVKNQPAGARGVLDFVVEHTKPALILLKDFHEYIRDQAEIRRRLRDVYYESLNRGKFVFISSPAKVIPQEIEREIAYIKLPMPDLDELQALVAEEGRSIAGREVSTDAVYVLGRALQGLSFNEARHALRYAAARAGRLDADVVPLLQEEKRLLVRKTGLMEYVPDTINIDQLGGLDIMKQWLRQRRDLFYSRESISSEIVPRGVLLMGVSGCGKSLSARVIANVFGLPLYRVEMSQVFSSGLGNAERQFAEACRTMEEIAPAVVWFDEIENGISRQHSDNSGVLDRIFGYFLTWMQEKPTGLFVAATANRIDLLPAEMIRKGRFDQVFFIDLPEKEERLEILRIHLARRNVGTEGLPLDLIATRTEGWTGAEIEQFVVSALTAARLENQPLNETHLYDALKEIVPLSRTMKEQVAQIRGWAFERAVRASSRE
jgi:ATP-dependent 26S proteasome regulatory subunit